MSRAKREKKNKMNLKVWIPIICMIVVGVTFYMIYDIQNKIEKVDDNSNTKNQEQQGENIDNANNISENFVEENNVSNEISNTADLENDNTSNQMNTSTSQSNQSSAPAIPAVTDQKQKAIELVKKEWGKDDTVDYLFDHVNENGEYVVAVKDRATATVKYYFRVNLETGAVELD